MEVTLGDRSKR